MPTASPVRARSSASGDMADLNVSVGMDGASHTFFGGWWKVEGMHGGESGM